MVVEIAQLCDAVRSLTLLEQGVWVLGYELLIFGGVEVGRCGGGSSEVM